MKKILFFISVFTAVVVGAQDTNLIQNGGFEETRSYSGNIKFQNWIFDRFLSAERYEGHQGENSVKMHTNSGKFQASKHGKYNIIDVEGDVEYELSLWGKGKIGSEKIEPIITWYNAKGDKLTGGGKQSLGELRVSKSWKKESVRFKSPSIAASAGLAFKIFDSGKILYVDEISLIKTGSTVTVSPPSGIEAVAYQREIELSWYAGKPNTKWEISLNGVDEIVGTNTHIIKNLKPNTPYRLKIRTLENNKTSEFSKEELITTKPYTKTKDDPFRVPHLRTLTEYGTPKRTIDLFYNDLYNLKAEINYFIDGVEVSPNQGKLVFTKKGKQVLKIVIKEAKDFEWEMEYELNVQ